jgi:tetratricopeptide (TPR) repeat protein
VDYRAAVEGLVDASAGRDGKRLALTFLAQELVRQRASDSCFTFQRRAHGILEPHEILAALEAARTAHPDLWQTTSAIADELLEQGRLDDAAAALDGATRRFPLVAPLWLDRARVCGRRGDAAAEVESLEKAALQSPGWTVPLQRLGAALQRQGRFADAALALRRAIALDPADSGLLGMLAESLRDAGQADEAREALARTVALDPRHGWAWSALRELVGDAEALAVARGIVQERPRDTGALIALVRQLPADELDEQLALLERVTSLEPRHVDAHDLRATLLAEAGRTAQALAACLPAVFAGAPPCELLGRRAWVLACSGRRSEAIAEMTAVLERHPDYEWGTRMLAEWTAEYGSPAEAVDAAERLVRVVPGSAVAYTMRGAARLRAGDAERGRGDLEHALAIDPDHAEAGARLFDALLAAERFDAAEGLLARLQPHMSAEQRSCRAIRVLAARAEQEQALARLAAELAAGRAPGAPLTPALHAVHGAFGASALADAAVAAAAGLHPEAAGLVGDVLVQRGARDEAARVLDALGQRADAAGGFCRSWLLASSEQPGDRVAAERLRQLAPRDPESLVLAARAHGAEPAARRLRLYEEVLALDPAQLEARDMRAVVLQQLGRHEDARAACRKVDGEREVPGPLRARAAWLEASAGRVAEARRLMRGVVEDHPLHGWAWDRLLEWGFREEGGAGAYLADAKAYCAVFPGEPAAQGYLGDAYRRSGRPREAEAAFRRSLELDTGYEWGRVALADLMLAEGRARDALGAVAAPEGSPQLLLREIRAALALRDFDVARAAWLRLLAADTDDDVRRRGLEAFSEAKAEDQLRAAFDAALAQPDPPDAAASLLLEWLGSGRKWRDCDQVLARLAKARRSLRAAALAGYIRALRAASDKGRLERLVKAERAALREDDNLWGLAGHALSLVDDRAAVEWMRDWKKRKTSPWALNGLAISLRRLHRLDEALRVSRHASTLAADHITPCHRAWLGIETALGGRIDEAESLLRGLEFPEESKGFYDALVLLARAAITARRSRGDAFDEARRLIGQADALAGKDNPDSRALRRRVVERVARERGGVLAWLWRLLAAS